MTAQFQFDSLNRLTNNAWTMSGGTLAKCYYQLGRTGNRTNLTKTLQSVTTNRVSSWQYDSLYRLTTETIGGTNTSYGMDAVGNRLSRSTGIGGLPAQSFTYGTNDWLATDAYDSNGSTLWTTNAGLGTGPYAYDPLNHLVSVANTVVKLGYDGDANRAWKSTSTGTNTFYLLEDRNPSGYVQVLEEWTVVGATTNLARIYNYGSSLVSQRQPNVSTDYFISDGHGSTRLLTDTGGNVVNAFTYDAYGNLIYSTVSPQTFYLYTGQQWDPDLGQYSLRARTYNGGTGRFWTRDDYEGNQSNPLSLHKYLYCADSPANRSDPSGTSDLVSTEVSIGTALILSAIVIPAVMDVTWTIRNHTTGNSLNQQQRAQLTQARQFIRQNQGSIPANAKSYTKTALGASVRVHDTLSANGSRAWGATQLYGQWAGKVIHLDKSSFLLDKRLLASLLYHEAVHAYQWIPTESSAESEAFQVQSDVLRAWGLTADSIGDARILFPGDRDAEFLDDVISGFEEFHIVNPAWKR